MRSCKQDRATERRIAGQSVAIVLGFRGRTSQLANFRADELGMERVTASVSIQRASKLSYPGSHALGMSLLFCSSHHTCGKQSLFRAYLMLWLT